MLQNNGFYGRRSAGGITRFTVRIFRQSRNSNTPAYTVVVSTVLHWSSTVQWSNCGRRSWGEDSCPGNLDSIGGT